MTISKNGQTGTLGGATTVNGTLSITSGSTLALSSNTLTINSDFTNVNGATISQNGAGGNMTVNGAYTNHGLHSVTNTGTLTVTGLLTNCADGTITRGASSTGAWNLSGGFTNQGTYTAATTTSPLTLGASSPFANTGRFTNTGGGTLTFNNTLTNNGDFYHVATSAITVAGAFVNTDSFHVQSGSGAVTFSSTFSNSGVFSYNGTGALTVTGLATNTGTGLINRAAASAFTFNGGFTNDGTYATTDGVATPLTLGTSSPFIQGATGVFTNTNGALSFGSTFSNSGRFTTTGTGNVTFTGLATNDATGTMERATGSTGTYTFNGGFTNNGTFRNATTTAGFTVGTAAGVGGFTNGSGSNFDNSGNATLTFNGDFVNNDEDPNWGTATIVFQGTASTSLGGTQSPGFTRLQVNKTGAPLPSLTMNTSLTSSDLVLTSGYLATNGYNLTVNDSVLGAAAGILNITGAAFKDAASTVTVKTLWQGATTGVGQVLVAGDGATLNITDQHILNYGGAIKTNYFLLSGADATVNYQNASGTGNSASLVLTTSSGTNATTCGWFATAGTVNFYGNIYSPYAAANNYQYFKADAGATVRFIGSSPSEVNLAVTAAPNSGRATWDFGTLQIAKTGSPAPAVTITSMATNLYTNVNVSGGVTVNADNTLSLEGKFYSASYGYNLPGGIVNDGTVRAPAGMNGKLSSGSIVNRGSFVVSTSSTVFTGPAYNSLTGSASLGGGNITFNSTFTNDGCFVCSTAAWNVIMFQGSFCNGATAQFSVVTNRSWVYFCDDVRNEQPKPLWPRWVSFKGGQKTLSGAVTQCFNKIIIYPYTTRGYCSRT